MSTLAPSRSALTLRHHRDAMRMREPFRISGFLFEAMPAVVATLGTEGVEGRGEAAGVYYLNDDPAHIEGELERVRPEVEGGIDRAALQTLLPPGGARNALDCALWELESVRAGKPVWALAGVPEPRALVTTYTLPAEEPTVLLQRLAPLGFARAIKLKLAGDLAADTAKVEAVRAARPDVWLSVDANQGFRAQDLDALAAMLVDQRVALLEQPLPRGDERQLAGWKPPLPVAADESMLDLAELETYADCFQVVNIKLDKCGGLTEALAMAERARTLGLGVMVGNMAGSTLSTAPAFVLAQLCDVVDLDGPAFLADDPLAEQIYDGDGHVYVPARLWGHG